LLDLRERRWEDNLLGELGLDPEKLGRLVDGTQTLALTPGAVSELGEDFPLVVGSGDGPLANLGSGAAIYNDCVATIGTSGAIRVFSAEPLLDREQRTWCYMLDRDTYVAGGAINNGGLVLTWLRDTLGLSGEEYEVINAYVRDVPLGSRGLLFLPFLTGERCPGWNPYARGLVVGLDLSHGQRELARAAMEGVTFRMYSVYRVLEELTGYHGELLVNGGFTHSDIWLQIMADIFGRRIVAHQNNEGSALGAVVMGMKAMGLIDDYRSLDYKAVVKAVKKPNGDHHRQYQKVYRLYEEIYRVNAPLFRQLATLR